MQKNMGLEVKQKQTLELHPALIQSLEILSMPYIELNQYLRASIWENPMLEINPDSEINLKEDGADREKSFEIKSFSEKNNSEIKITERADTLWKSYNSGVYEDDELDFLDFQHSDQTFNEFLHGQLGYIDLDKNFALLCKYIINSLNKRGYLDIPTEDISELLKCEHSYVMEALDVVQSLEPAGVGARNLEECLLLQLKRRGNFDENNVLLIQEGLDLVAKNDIKKIMKLLDCKEKEAIASRNIIKSLNPIPSQGYNTGEEKSHVFPDAKIINDGTGFTIQINRNNQPKLIINKNYSELLENTDDDETGSYLRQNLNKAKELIRAVDERESTLMRIINLLLVLQPQFFIDGKTLEPMTMTGIAERLDINVSTVSRAIQGKYIEHDGGTIELSKLFTSGLAKGNGEKISSKTIEDKIVELVKSEDTENPLSDEEIRVALEGNQIDVSRRTVAKYRKRLGIDSSFKRVKYKNE